MYRATVVARDEAMARCLCDLGCYFEPRPRFLRNEECPHYARPVLESVGVWKYSLSEASCSMRRLSSDMRPSAVLMGMQSWQRVSPQGWREYSQYWMAPASMPSAMSQRSASLSLSAILLA